MSIKSGLGCGLLITSLLFLSTPLRAASLQVAPVSVDVIAPGAAAVLTLQNNGSQPLNTQIRVFRWTQIDGIERLVPTGDLVASPPAASLPPRTSYTVRIVRVGGKPIIGEESYRLLVDELPTSARKQGAAIQIVLRYSIPAFFEPPQTSEPKLSWSFTRKDGHTYLVASNAGDRRIRLSRLKLRDAKDNIVSFGDGLTGYVLAHSLMRWEAPRGAGRLSGSGMILVSSVSDLGPINAQASGGGVR